MSDAIIAVSKLGKKYRLQHKGEGQRYTSLRDVLANKVKGLLRNGNPEFENRSSIEDFWALKDVSFEVKRGEVVGIIGRNGAGKSTLLKILSRITESTTGSVHLKGRVASLLEVGTGFHPELTGRENIFLNGAILGMSRAEIRKKFDEIVAFADVEKFLDTPIKRYSSGMYVRLAFAVAAHLEPEILIVDEVLAVGDAEFQKKSLGKINDVATQGRTVLFVSHNMAAVASLCGRIVILDSGSVRFDGAVETGIANYLTQEKLPTSHFSREILPPLESIHITKIELCNDDGHRADVVDSGKPLVVHIHYRSKSVVTQNLIISISVSNSSSVRLFQHHSRLNKTVFQNLPTTGMFTFRLAKLPLPSSTYRLSAYLSTQQGVVDGVEDAFDFSVFDGSFYISGETSPISHGLMLVDGEWGFETA